MFYAHAMGQLLLVVAVVLIAGIGLYVASILMKSGGKQVAAALEPSEGEGALPYVQSPLMTRGEIDFYKTMQKAIGDRAVVFAQVPLGSVITIRSKTPDWQKWRNKIDRKTVDYVLCHPVTFSTIAVVELDDRSHQSEKRQERDGFVDRALEAARVRLVRVPASVSGWSIDELRARLIVE